MSRRVMRGPPQRASENNEPFQGGISSLSISLPSLEVDAIVNSDGAYRDGGVG